MGPTLERLYTKQAVGGSISAPDFGSGDLQVSVRSAALGDILAAGQSRWHFVYYRDPILIGGCPPTSTLNWTKTGMVTWSPWAPGATPPCDVQAGRGEGDAVLQEVERPTEP